MPEDETDVTDTPDDVVAAVADAIRATHAIRPLSEEERAQRELDNQLWREEQRWHVEQRRLERERAQAEAAEAARREKAERQRKADEALRQKQRTESIQREAENRLNQRLRSNDRKWVQLEQSVALARRQQMRQMLFQNTWNDLDELQRRLNPPPPAPGPEIIYVEPDRGTGRLGYADFSPELMKQPVSWWR